jgi:hypothetical protein
VVPTSPNGLVAGADVAATVAFVDPAPHPHALSNAKTKGRSTTNVRTVRNGPGES